MLKTNTVGKRVFSDVSDRRAGKVDKSKEFAVVTGERA